MIIGKQEIIILYEHFYSIKYGNSSYKFTPSTKADQEIDKFLFYLDQKHKLISLGPVFLTRYFYFQFKRVENLVFKRFSSKDKSGKIQIYDIIGKKAISYWEKRDTSFDFILPNYINVKFDKKEDFKKVTIYEDIEKQRFFNTTRGLINCLDKTTLFDHKSSFCILCTMKNDCKKLLEKNYNKIYVSRGYGTAA